MQKLFRKIFESAPDATIIVDSNGRIQMVNEQVKNLFGYEKEEVVGEPVETLIPLAYREKHVAHREAYVKHPHTRKMDSGLELVSRRKGGSEFLAEISLSPFYVNQQLFVEASVRNVTEKNKLLNEIKMHDEQVSEQNKRLSNFAHIVSHNLRSYAGNFKMMLMFLEQSKNEAEKETIMGHLKKISNGLSETIGHLNEIVAVQVNINLQRERISLDYYVNKAIDILSADIHAKEVELHNEVSPNTVLEYNPAYLESIILNFLSNGIKYSYPGRRPVITLKSLFINNQVVLEIADNGRGIDLEKHGEKLFGMYKTFHGNGDAKGIGLFITKNQVEAMGGKIEVQSQVNVGTTFRVYLS